MCLANQETLIIYPSSDNELSFDKDNTIIFKSGIIGDYDTSSAIQTRIFNLTLNSNKIEFINYENLTIISKIDTYSNKLTICNSLDLFSFQSVGVYGKQFTNYTWNNNTWKWF